MLLVQQPLLIVPEESHVEEAFRSTSTRQLGHGTIMIHSGSCPTDTAAIHESNYKLEARVATIIKRKP